MADDWDGATKAALKILGDKGKVPKLPATIPKSIADDDKVHEEFNKNRTLLEATLLKAMNSVSGVKDAMVQFSDKVEADDLGLDPKNKDDAKKIAEAQKVLGEFLSGNVDLCDTNLKNLREVNKHLDNIAKYKQA